MENDFSPMIDYHFKVEEGVTKEKVNEFCDDRNDLLHLPKLLREFAQQDQTYGEQQIVDSLNILNSLLDACKDMNTFDTFQTMMLVWDTSDSFVLTPFKSDFVGYVECDIYVKDVTKFNKVIGIGTTIQKLKDSKGHDV